MAQKTIAGISLSVTDEGYLEDASVWTKEIAAEIAKEDGIELSETHYAVLEFIRNKAQSGDTLTIRSVGKSGVVDIKGFYQLFPGAPLKKATRIAGVTKPSSCI